MTDPQSLPRQFSRVPAEGQSLAPRALGPDYAGGEVELWVGEFTNWRPGDVKAIFDRMNNG